MGIGKRIRNIWAWGAWPPNDYFEWTGWVSAQNAPPGTKYHTAFSGTSFTAKAEFIMPDNVKEIMEKKADATIDDVIIKS